MLTEAYGAAAVEKKIVFKWHRRFGEGQKT
jgi:hypothetical protein